MSTPLIDKAFLPEHENLINSINAFGYVIAFIIQCYIGGLLYSKLRRSGSKINPKLVFLFTLSAAFALLFTISCILIAVFLVVYGWPHLTIKYSISISSFFFWFFLSILLLTLFTRLYLTFRETIWKMNRRMITIFIIIFVFLFVSNIVAGLGNALYVHGHETVGWQLGWAAAYPSLFFYVVGSALCVRLYTSNLSANAKWQAESIEKEIERAESVSLNRRQLRLLNLSAKYILLFFLAVSSSIFSLALIRFVSYRARGAFASFDLCVNLWCLYLQFAFAEKQYQKCCGCLDSRCRAKQVNRIKKIMHKEHMELKREKDRISSAGTSQFVIKQVSGTVEIWFQRNEWMSVLCGTYFLICLVVSCVISMEVVFISMIKSTD